MKNYLVLSIITFVALSACKEKKASKDESPISALSIIKGQLNKLDSSMYAFTKFERNGNKTDTIYLKREEIRKLAEPFLSLPEIADKNYHKKYDEEKIIDNEGQTLSIIATAKDENQDAEIQRQMFIIGLADISNGNVKSIFIDSSKKSGDSIIEHKLFWEIDKSFSIQKAIIKETEPEKANYIMVAWQ